MNVIFFPFLSPAGYPLMIQPSVQIIDFHHFKKLACHLWSITKTCFFSLLKSYHILVLVNPLESVKNS